ncbi:uncharacterized protein LOC127718129 [Mytilus californianus]|uniref:uncharacterized protein LOC127718129 n=1 Tax=Mytilus californianus TaxID=6549 RepID=UPI0022466B7C|nr:uncharacterized protein LOC127718129 [Mytilus californianus]
MASKSASLRKAQVPLCCHFCNKQGVQWKCEECDVFMCTSCKEKIHQRLKSAQNHEIVSVYDICKDNPPRKEVASEVISSVFNTYTTTVPVINSLLCYGDDYVYLIYHNIEENARLVKGKMLKSSIRILQTLEKQIFDIAVNTEGEIVFDEVGHDNVYSLTDTGEIKTVLETSPMRPTALHVNRDNDLIVGFREHGSPFPVKDFSVRQVVIFDNNYKRKVILEADKKGIKLFSYPARIKTDSKNVLYVTDWIDKNQSGRIVAVDTNGRLKFTYNGNPDLQTFFPNGIAITPSDNIILTDHSNNALYVMNTRGELLALQFVDNDHNIERPCSLCIDNEGYLLIGNAPFLDNKDSNAIIYVTKIIKQLV